jgi:tetratricopeptide (TPR) repeat protein
MAQILTNPAMLETERLPMQPVWAPLVDSLTALQKVAAGQADGVSFPALTQQVRDQGAPIDLITVEIVGMVFDYIYNDRRLPDTIKQQLLRLQVVAVKAALLDRGFFARRHHPLRRLIDRISDVGADPDFDSASSSPMLTGFDQLLAEVIRTFQSDLQVFEDAIEKVDAIEREALARKADSHADTATVAARQEVEQLAVVDARSEIEQRLNKNVPSFVRDFLLDTWSGAMARARAEQGDAGGYEAAEEHEQERLPSYDLEEMGAADVSRRYADGRQVYVNRAVSVTPEVGDDLPSFPLDEPDADMPAAYLEAVAHHQAQADAAAAHDQLRGEGSSTVRPEPGDAADLDNDRTGYFQSSPGLRAPPEALHVQAAAQAPRAPSAAPRAHIGVVASGRELEDALDEAEFFCSRGLLDDARTILLEQLTQYPNNPLLRERIDAQDAQDEPRAGSGARARPRDEQDRAYDIAASLDALESLDDIQPAEGNGAPDQQVDVEEVFAKFKEGVAKQISVDDSDSHYNLGIAYKEMMLIDDAIREFEVAAQDPKRACVCRSMIGMIEIERGRLNEAIDAFLQGLNSPNKDPQQETVLCYEIGAAYEAKKMNKDALSYYQKAMRRDPNYRDIQERVRRLAKNEMKPQRQAVSADDEFDRAFDDLVSKA